MPQNPYTFKGGNPLGSVGTFGAVYGTSELAAASAQTSATGENQIASTAILPRPWPNFMPRYIPKHKPRCTPKPIPDSDYGDKDKDHCIRLYALCKNSGWKPKRGWRCDKCLGFCTSNGYWPFDKCPAPEEAGNEKPSFCEAKEAPFPTEG